MAIVIGEALLGALGGAYTWENVRKVREVLHKAGVKDIELHPLEVAAIRDARSREAVARAFAEKMLAAGPMPECRCTVRESDDLIARTNGCKLGHKPDETPDVVA